MRPAAVVLTVVLASLALLTGCGRDSTRSAPAPATSTTDGELAAGKPPPDFAAKAHDKHAGEVLADLQS